VCVCIVGYVRSIDRSCRQFYRLLISTQAFNHFIEERSFGCDRLGTLTSRRSGDLAFFDDCVQRIDNYDSETNLIDIDDNLPPRSPFLILMHFPDFIRFIVGFWTRIVRYCQMKFEQKNDKQKTFRG